jgi:hypothetical protein
MLHRKTFLLVEDQALVRLDIAQALLELFPEADIVEARGAAPALRSLERIARLTGAISGIGFETTRNSGLGARVTALGGWLICLDERHTDGILAEGWHPLPQPFGTEDLQHLVRARDFDEVRSPAAH